MYITLFAEQQETCLMIHFDHQTGCKSIVLDAFMSFWLEGWGNTMVPAHNLMKNILCHMYMDHKMSIK